MNKETNQNAKTIAAAAILAVLILIIGLLIGRFLFTSSDSASSIPSSSMPEASTGSAGTSGGIEIPGFSLLTIKAGQREQAVTLSNPEDNNCYMVFSLYMPDGTLLYKSGAIAPGSSIDKIYLDTLPAVGTYEGAILRHDCYTYDDERAQLNGADSEFTLEVTQ